MSKTYILQKDLPCGAKKGYEFHFHISDNKYHVHDKVNFNGWVSYDAHVVENNPEWFLPKVEKPPLGLIPLSIHNENRLKEINAAIERYKEVRKDIPKEWIIEKDELESKQRCLFDIDKIKKHIEELPKEEPKEYEILTFIWVDPEGKFTIPTTIINNMYGRDEEEKFLNSINYKIYSIKRLSDGEVFTIGDNITFKNYFTKIILFEFIVESEFLLSKKESLEQRSYLDSLKKELRVKIDPPLNGINNHYICLNECNKVYTKKEILKREEKAFYASRMIVYKYDNYGAATYPNPYKYLTFQDYKNSQHQKSL